MKEYISSYETKYIKRRLTPKIKDALQKFPVIVISGARQVGKSTMLLNEFSDFSYFTLDDFDTIDMIKTDPLHIFNQYENIIIDESQKLPEIFDTIKFIVDRDKRKRIILSGSSNILLMKNITESLSGRALYFELMPFTFGEFNGRIDPVNFTNLLEKKIDNSLTTKDISINKLMLKGFMPPNILEEDDYKNVILWLDGYIKTYLERDLRQLSQIDSIIDFRKLMQMLALRTGNILKQADISKDTGISTATTHRYIKLLEISNIIERIPAYFSNRGKRLVKSPKIFFIDTALAIFLSGYFDEDTLSNSREIGGFFETMIFIHLKSLCSMLTPHARLYYWRTVSGREVDFIIEYGKKLLALEVKLSSNVLTRDIKNILSFIDDYTETTLGIILYTGNEIKWLHSKVVAIPWWYLDF
jgi:predicted AAA+ superfamily ATPase